MQAATVRSGELGEERLQNCDRYARWCLGLLLVGTSALPTPLTASARTRGVILFQ